jgi:small subunit ribosomal protein S4
MTLAKKAKGNTAITLQQLLETRLDNIVRRLGVVRSIWAARQLVAHGHVKVNGKKMDFL